MSDDRQTDITMFKTGVCRTISHESRSWDRVKADHVRRTGLAKEETSFTSRQHTFLLNLKGSSERGEYFLDGRPAEFVPRKPGSILFIPAGCNWKGWEIGASSAAYLSISVDPGLIAELLGRHLTDHQSSFFPELGCEDPVLANAARGIGAEVKDRNPMSSLLVESYTATLFVQLLRRQRHIPNPRRAGGLPPASLRRILERIREDLAADLTLSQLADLTGLSVPHFCRAFKQTMGCPPYAFVIRQRIERAKEHLHRSEMSVTEIALACGFSSSSHFANTFRREVGMPPLAYRAH
jgi:AraC-like DNA-binding protein